MGERPSEHRFIVTAPGRGYRFVAAVRGDGAPRDASTPGELSVAVLPFVDHSQSQSHAFLGEAFAADLIHALSSRRRLRVTAPASSLVYDSRHIDAGALSRTLNVELRLVGLSRAAAAS